MTAAAQAAPQAQDAPTLTIDGTTQLPCPHCGTAEHLSLGEWWMDAQHEDVMVVECQECHAKAPATIWNQLPRRDATGGVA